MALRAIARESLSLQPIQSDQSFSDVGSLQHYRGSMGNPPA
ncbi:MAG: hypothetical protein R3C05_11120 [Pirellulaceae bacterium]